MARIQRTRTVTFTLFLLRAYLLALLLLLIVKFVNVL